MPLPTDARTPWPPKHLTGELDDIARAAAWYSSDTNTLRNMGATGTEIPQAGNEPDNRGGSRPGNRGKFWSRRGTDTAPNRQQYHVPLFADIASTSADLVVGDEPKIRVPNPDGEADQSLQTTQDRLDVLVAEGGLHNGLLEALEVCAALGGVWLLPTWDSELADHPMLTSVHPDAAAPEWRKGLLSAVTFWTTVHREGAGTKTGQVWRHLERHEPGVILHGLFLGKNDTLGKRIGLEAHPDTEMLPDEVPLPFDGLAPRYIPNVLPNRHRRHSKQGRPDCQGTFDLLDGLDETWTSWMRDLRLGQARIIAAQDALDRGSGRGGGAYFDPDREVYAGLDIDPNQGTLIEPVQFAIRVAEHERTAMAQIERIVSTAGYAPQTFGLHIEGRAEAGTALRVRERRTMRTRDRKQGYATKPVEEVLANLLAIDADIFGSGVTPVRPSVEWGEALVDDPREKAETLRLLKEAKAASTQTRVKMVSPDLQGEDLQKEVDRVKAEEGIGALADPEGGPFDGGMV